MNARDDALRPVVNESGIEIAPLYTAADVEASGGTSLIGDRVRRELEKASRTSFCVSAPRIERSDANA